MEELLHESPVLHRFVGVDIDMPIAPDETTVLRFSHVLEQHDLCGRMLDVVNLHLESKGTKIHTGTIVDVAIVHALSGRDTEMHRTKKGNQWCLGLKAHVGVAAKTRTVQRW